MSLSSSSCKLYDEISIISFLILIPQKPRDCIFPTLTGTLFSPLAFNSSSAISFLASEFSVFTVSKILSIIPNSIVLIFTSFCNTFLEPLSIYFSFHSLYFMSAGTYSVSPVTSFLAALSPSMSSKYGAVVVRHLT